MLSNRDLNYESEPDSSIEVNNIFQQGITFAALLLSGGLLEFRFNVLYDRTTWRMQVDVNKPLSFGFNNAREKNFRWHSRASKGKPWGPMHIHDNNFYQHLFAVSLQVRLVGVYIRDISVSTINKTILYSHLRTKYMRNTLFTTLKQTEITQMIDTLSHLKISTYEGY